MLEVRSLTKYYGALPALRDASFVARPGQILGYLGPNGSGKSTTVRMLVGLMTPTSGDVLWHGRSIFDDLPAFRRRLGYVPEEPHLYTHLTAPEYLRLVGGLRDLDERPLGRRIDRLLDLFGLAGDCHSTLSSFSKGMRQKVLLAAALLHDPDLIILDEPFSGLDVGAALMLRAVIKGLADDGRTILMSSHVIDVVEQLCTEVVILSAGRVVAHDRVDHLRQLQQDRSLEHVFVRLAVPDDMQATARSVIPGGAGVRRHRARLLSRLFFDRLFDNDLFSSSTAASGSVLWLLAALASPGVMLSGSQLYFYAHARTFAPEALDRIMFVSQAFHVDVAMAVAGLVTMLIWTSLTPDRRDALVLGPLPVTAGEQSIARLAALTRFFTMFAVAVSVPTAVAFTFVTVGDASLAEVGARIAGHIAATMLGAAFVFFSLVAAQLALAAAGGPAAVRIATWPLQAAALFAVVGALSFTTRLADLLLAHDASSSPWAAWNPAAWFIGIYRWLAGDPRPVFASLAVRGILASALAVVTTLVAYPMAYQRCVQQAIAGDGQRAGWGSGAVMRLWQRGLALRVRTPLERGLASFITATLTRSPAHRFLIGSYLGVALLCALPMMTRLLGPASTASAEYAWFSVPLGLLCWMTAAMRVAMMLPVEPGANWIVQLTEPVDKRRVLSTAVIVIEGATVIPLAAGFGAGATAAGGVSLGAMVLLVVAGTGLALVQVLTLTLRTVPCTCTYRPGQLRLRVLWPVYLLTWTLIAYRLPYVALWALGDPFRSLGLVTSLFAAGLGLRVWRLARARRLQSFIYDEGDASGATTIG